MPLGRAGQQHADVAMHVASTRSSTRHCMIRMHVLSDSQTRLVRVRVAALSLHRRWTGGSHRRRLGSSRATRGGRRMKGRCVSIAHRGRATTDKIRFRKVQRCEFKRSRGLVIRSYTSRSGFQYNETGDCAFYKYYGDEILVVVRGSTTSSPVKGAKCERARHIE